MSDKSHILVIDDEKNYLLVLQTLLEDEGYTVTAISDPETALAFLAESEVDVVVTDMKMPKVSGREVLQHVKKSWPYIPVLILTAFGSIESAVEAMKYGAFDYITKPFSNDELLLSIHNATELARAHRQYRLLQEAMEERYSVHQIVGRSRAIRDVLVMVDRAAPSRSTVLITGESGTGKELVARAIHYASPRKEKPFVSVNCMALNPGVLESELFGYEEGAFTGAKKGGRLGLLEISHQGTLFLDEVEGMSPALQVKLLRVLQEREIMRVGGTSIIPIDVRIVAATNESLERKVAEGTFRRDLYYRLSTLPIVIPPLSERGDDLFLILEQFQKELGGSFRLTPQVRGFLKSYSWPGNIRELRNVVEYFLYTGHDPITMEDLPPTVFHRAPQAPIRQLPETPQQPSSDVFRFVLEQLYQASEARQPIGRERLLQLARDAFVPTSQQEIRSILAQMADQGLVRVSRGRGGSQLTPKGRELWEIGQR